ncbi:glycosyltransferase [Psychroserpens sp.]|uniref:glycosyltransferase n=1 Tax=Psychroserpens sp. TaxID=2020870 RepID=UPI001B1A171D|nr:glycosyltransferase [Psychroserpens sp.]MBO6606923.1 glycosyltransferase [Psychroserpens sp.]MBO6654069.1 glycosyltransferase [Psychroserpens sp.]MBO6682645.1 glycosyltransferase [Psychroserpens sp.]MBO6750695.1 glycosyltransferase [Psychroserpens sp.]MBO6915876.1 glycosyltransferase [Psychroserpens sp.]
MMDNLTIIIPVYNEEDNLHRLKDSLQSYINQAKLQTKILFVNDGSTDNSEPIIIAICEENSDFNYLSFTQNYGLSAALKAGFDNVKTSLVGYMDADLQTDPNDFNLLLDHIDNFTMVTGIRSNRKDNFIKRMSSALANNFRRMFTHDGIDDTGCPLKVIRTSSAKMIPMFKGMHRFLPAMIILQNGTVKQVPVQHFPRRAGKSKFGIWNRSFGPLADCFAFLWMKRRYIRYDISNSDL